MHKLGGTQLGPDRVPLGLAAPNSRLVTSGLPAGSCPILTITAVPPDPRCQRAVARVFLPTCGPGQSDTRAAVPTRLPATHEGGTGVTGSPQLPCLMPLSETRAWLAPVCGPPVSRGDQGQGTGSCGRS